MLRNIGLRGTMLSSDSDTSEDEDRLEVHQLLYLVDNSRRRPEDSDANVLIEDDLCSMDDEAFIKAFGIHRFQFHKLFLMLERKIRRSHTPIENMETLRPRDRILICLRFLATGRSFEDLSVQYELPHTSVAVIIHEVCSTISEHLGPIVMPYPTEEIWKMTAEDFMRKHNMPNCLGSINGGLLNVMNQSALDFVGLVDAHCKFIMINVGKYGLYTDLSRALSKSKIGEGFEKRIFKLPPNKPLVENTEPLPHIVLVGSYFPKRPYFLRKYTSVSCINNMGYKVFNCRVTPARDTAKEAFTRLRHRWRIMQGIFPVPPEKVEQIVMAVCCLYNYFCLPPTRRARYTYKPMLSPGILKSIQASIPDNSNSLEHKFMQYFVSRQGQVPWQWAPLEFSKK